MTEQEAIKKLKYTKRNCGMPTQGNTWKPNAETIALDMAISALEKQIAKKPTYEGDGYDDEGFIAYDTWYCPNCNKSYEVDYDEYDYCPNCGQKIDWSEI